MKNPWVIIGLITAVLFGGAVWYSSVAADRNNEGVEVISHVKGNPEASVVLTEYADMQCPACAAFLPVVTDIMEQFGDDIRFEYKHFPLPIHNHAMQAALAAEAAGQQGQFFAFHDIVFQRQSEWSQAATPAAHFMTYAEELGLDMDTFRRHMNASVLRDKIRTDFNQGRELGVTGTPTFFLNGQRMMFETYEGFFRQVAEAVDPTASVGASGTSTPETEPVRFGI